MMRRVPVLLTLAAACAGPSEPTCDVCTTSATVYGTIVDADGSLIVGVPIDVRVYLDDCPPTQLRGGSDGAVPRTDDNGAYRTSVISLWQPFTARCFRVTVNPESDPRWPTGAVQVSGALDLRADTGDEPRDSMRLDVQIQ